MIEQVFSLQRGIEMQHNLIWLLLDEPHITQNNSSRITKGVKRKEILLGENTVKYAKKNIHHLVTIIVTSLNPMPNAQVCVYLTVHITKLQLQTTFPKPLYIPHSACILWDPGRWKSWCLHCLWPVRCFKRTESLCLCTLFPTPRHCEHLRGLYTEEQQKEKAKLCKSIKHYYICSGRFTTQNLHILASPNY
jgi:hypothetical protein